MVQLILAAFILGAPVVSAQDTLLDLREGDRLVLPDFSGEVRVLGWDRDYLVAESDSDRANHFEFRRSGNRVVVQVVDRKNRSRSEDLTLRVPHWVGLELSGKRVEAEVREIEGPVRIRNLNGELTLEDLGGRVDVVTASSEITGTRLRGSATLKTGNDDITIRDSSGPLDLETVSGGVELVGVTSRALAVRTTSGDIDFSGPLLPEGEYQFRSHRGDVTLILEEPLNIDVSILAYQGEFESDFPVRARGFKSGEGMDFRVGSGGGTLTIESFTGEVSLLRGGS